MKNCEKDELRQLVLLGLSVKRIEGMGFKRATIKKYYKAFNPKSDLELSGEALKEQVKQRQGYIKGKYGEGKWER